jgi:hypothetical protein
MPSGFFALAAAAGLGAESVRRSGVCLFAFLPPSLSSRPLFCLRSGSAESNPLTTVSFESSPNFFARSANFFVSSSSEMPKRLARAARFAASFSASVCWIPIEKSCLGASGAGAASSVAAAAGAASPSAGAAAFRSEVVEGSTSTIWFGTATGFATWPLPPAATAAAAGALVALSSSSQSISSSPPITTCQHDATRDSD